MRWAPTLYLESTSNTATQSYLDSIAANFCFQQLSIEEIRAMDYQAYRNIQPVRYTMAWDLTMAARLAAEVQPITGTANYRVR